MLSFPPWSNENIVKQRLESLIFVNVLNVSFVLLSWRNRLIKKKKERKKGCAREHQRCNSTRLGFASIFYVSSIMMVIAGSCRGEDRYFEFLRSSIAE